MLQLSSNSYSLTYKKAIDTISVPHFKYCVSFLSIHSMKDSYLYQDVQVYIYV